ncbi:hypothetical protein BH10PSE17_BH10PSE17_09180 [soil metagenome]
MSPRPAGLAALLPAAIVLMLVVSGCGGGGGSSDDDAAPAAPVVPAIPGTVVTPAKMNDQDLNTILFQARAGDTITLPAGKYVFKRSLKLTVDNVTVVGVGNGTDAATSTILSFKDAAESNGVEARFVKGVTLKRFAVEDAVGNGVFVTDSSNVVIDTVRAEWTTDPSHTSRMAYGLYPVACENVVVTNSIAIGSNDSGVYVGQSNNIRVINNEAYANVAGVEIENSHNAIVEGNSVHDNSAGILVFAVPGTARFLDNNGTIVRGNKILSNNLPIPDTASGVVREVPPGTGVMLMAAQNTEVVGNTIKDHVTAAVLMLSFESTGLSFDPKAYDQYLRGASIHGNSFENFGSMPAGAFADPDGLGPVIAGLFAALDAEGLPKRMAAVVWDGIVDPATATPDTVGADGEHGVYAGVRQICSAGNTTDLPVIAGQVSFENIDLDLHALLAGIADSPIFPFPPRLACAVTLPAVTGLP